MMHHHHPVPIFDVCMMMYRQEIMSRNVCTFKKLCTCIEVYLENTGQYY